MDNAVADTRELDFGQMRRQDQMMALGMVMKRIETDPFTGQRLGAGELAVEFDDADLAATHFKGALMGYLAMLGADVAEEAPGAVDLVVIAGVVPANALLGGRKVAAQIVESCAEVLRILLAEAVVTASEDAGGTEGAAVRVLISSLELGGKVNFEAQTMAGMVRFRGAVHAWDEPRVSYVLGATAERPYQLAWEFPLVEQVYGQNRLRWRDLRSPDFEPAEKRVVS